MLNVSVAVSSLPGNRFAGARRSLVADIGNHGSIGSHLLLTCFAARRHT